MNDNRTDFLQIRLTPEEKLKLKKLAKDNGMTMGTYIRYLIFGLKHI